MLVAVLWVAAYVMRPEPRHEGLNLAAWWSGEYSQPGLKQSLENLRSLGADSLAVVVTAYAPSVNSTTLSFQSPRTPTDEDLRRVFEAARPLDLRVAIKPHLDVDKDPFVWRGEIGSGFESDEEWSSWFSSYGGMLRHYAEISEASGAELLCVGTELDGTIHREAEWRSLIESVRDVYSGDLVYAANHGNEEKVPWWDAVDYIGVDAYYPLTKETTATLESLQSAWEKPIQTLAALSQKHDRKVLLMEVGYRSVGGALVEPWDFSRKGTVDLGIQALGYESLFESFWDRPWVAGVYLWHWSPDPDAGGPEDSGYVPWKKPAAELLPRWFRREP